ncbi:MULTISPECIES: porin family protein [unclassified Methylobacterium]|uniref:outer membrane protein n=1 Tax=unclassified Methylobacterium TaxID=2615210 RepID=UPI000700D164|nr:MULTISPECIES: porin family protein [unclassified Methylobacterium]KQP73627.1 porin [Methylobacterium sp. Leaf113]MCK2053313.1 porin family protein [Methylobacterium sp. 37f]
MISKFLLAGVASLVALGAANAADLPRREVAPVFTPIPVFTWTGIYVGTHSSYTFSDSQNIRTLGNNDNTARNVALGRRAPNFKAEQDGIGNIGGGIGYNYQLTPGSGFVIGAEADVTWTDIGKRRDYLGPAIAQNNFIPDPSSYRNRLNYLGTVQGRLGYAFDRFLVYGTGGFAYGEVKYQADFFNTAGQLAYFGRYKGMETGYVYGGGVEYAIPTDSFLNRFNFIGGLIGASAITLKAEYLRYDLGSRNVLVNNTGLGAPATGSYTSRFNTEGNLIKAGFNYKFGSY